MVWVALVGIVLQVGGLALAMVGVRGAYRSVVVGEDQSIGRASHRLIGEWIGRIWRAARDMIAASWVWLRRILRRGKRVRASATITISPATVTAVAGTPTITTDPGPPGEDATIEAKVDYLLGRVARIGEIQGVERERWRKAVNGLRREVQDLGEQLGETGLSVEQVRAATIGADGRVLVEAFLGLGLTAFGVLLTVAGLSW